MLQSRRVSKESSCVLSIYDISDVFELEFHMCQVEFVGQQHALLISAYFKLPLQIVFKVAMSKEGVYCTRANFLFILVNKLTRPQFDISTLVPITFVSRHTMQYTRAVIEWQYSCV